MRPAKTPDAQSSLCALWVAKDPSFLHADSEDSDQTGRMAKLICVFAWRTCYIVGFDMLRLKLCNHTKVFSEKILRRHAPIHATIELDFKVRQVKFEPSLKNRIALKIYAYACTLTRIFLTLIIPSANLPVGVLMYESSTFILFRFQALQILEKPILVMCQHKEDIHTRIQHYISSRSDGQHG